MKFSKISRTLTIAAAAWGLWASTSLAQTNLEFIQWWEPEMPAGALRGIMDDFEKANPDIKVTLVSGPYSTTHDQIVVGAASGTLMKRSPCSTVVVAISVHGRGTPACATRFEPSNTAQAVMVSVVHERRR